MDYEPDDLCDPWCDERNPRTVQFEQISAADYRIRGGIVKTPCDVRAELFSFYS